MTAVRAARRDPPSGRAIAEGALLADLTVMIVLAGLYVPYAGAALAAIAPLPLLLLVLRQGWRVSLEAFVAASLLIAFLTGPFTSLAIVTIAVRAFALGIGLRRGWRARTTVLAGTSFVWVIACISVTLVALVLPSWRAATEQGIAFTYHQFTALLGVLFRLFGQAHAWRQLHPRLEDLLAWLVKHWLEVLPLFAWPVLLVVCGAEYVIVEVVLPHFGFNPPPLLNRSRGRRVRRPGRVRRYLQGVLATRVDQHRGRQLRRSRRRLTPVAVPAEARPIVRSADRKEAGSQRRETSGQGSREDVHFD